MLSTEAGRLRPEYTERIGNTMSRKDLQQTIEQEPLRPGLEANLSRIKEIGGGTSDLLINPVRVSGIPACCCAARGCCPPPPSRSLCCTR